MDQIRDAILADSLDAIAGLPTPESYRAVLVRKDEQDMFEGLETKDKDPQQSLHVETSRLPSWAPARPWSR